MKYKHKKDTKQPMVKGILLGVLVALSVSVFLTAISAMLIVNGRIAESTMQYLAFGILFLSTLTGAFTCGKIIGEKPVQMCASVGLGYCFILSGMTILLFDGIFVNVVTSILIVLLGCAVSCMLCVRLSGRKKNKHVRFR